MKALFKPLYLLIAATIVVVLLVGYFFFSPASKKEAASDVYVVGFDPVWYPVDFQGKVYAFNFFTSELLQEIAQVENAQIRLSEESTDGLFSELQRDEIQGVLSAREDESSGRRERLLYSDPFYDFGIVLVVAADSSITSLADLKGNIVGTVRGPSIVSGLGADPTTFLVTYDNVLQALQRLDGDQVQAALLPFFTSNILVQSLFNGRLKIISQPIIPIPAQLVVVADARGTALLKIFNQGLKKIRDSGAYETLLKRWGLPDPTVPVEQSQHRTE